ncbi:MAG: hypothetical protein IPK52_07045 [Chloroflexi bacterium]|nr:hypothetical protein [Chloroflexota bacterium]
MAGTQIKHEVQPRVMGAKAAHYPESSRRFDLIFSVLSLWILAGLYLDGSAHHHIPDLIETFFTPWHAVLYSGFAVSAGLLLITQWRNVSQGYDWAHSLPKGYITSLFGSVIFLFSGVADFLWHTAFGFEVGLEALVSPSHLSLAVGGILIISGPLRATLHRSTQQVIKGWHELLPAILSLLGILSVLTFFNGDFAIITYPNFMVVRPPGDDTFFNDIHGLASVLIPSALLIGVILFALRHWTLPPGTLTLLITGNSLLMTWFHLKEVYRYPQILIAVVLAGFAADVLYALLKPSHSRLKALRLFAFAVPAILFALFFLTLITTAGIWWSVHLWTGAVFLAGVVGLLLSFLTHPSVDSKSSPA